MDKKPVRTLVALLGAVVLVDALVKRRSRGDGPGSVTEARTAPPEALASPIVIAPARQPTRRHAALPGLPRPSRRSAWRLASLAVAALLVVAALNLVQGRDEAPAPVADAASEGSVGPADDGTRVLDVTGAPENGRVEAPGTAQFVSEGTYSLALPARWDRVEAQGGATFAAVAPGGAADATLWVERDPQLDFATFKARSVEQLEQLAGSARVVERATGPTREATVIRIAAEAPPAAPRYEVLLRSSGELWYYLATTVQPDAPSEAIEAVELLQGSLIPQGSG